jgi:Domain of unknown function (DUF6916)
MTTDIAQLTAADFEPRIADEFRVPAPAGEIPLKLVEVRRLGKGLRQGDAFSLTFLSPPGPFLPQAIYPLQHPAFEALDLFLVPLGPKDGGNGYEAVFT